MLCCNVCIQQGVSLRSLCWHHEGKQFVSSLTDGSLNFWNMKCPQKPTSCIIPHCESIVFCSLAIISSIVTHATLSSIVCAVTLSITNWYCIKTAEWIEVVYSTESNLCFSYSVQKVNLVSAETGVLALELGLKLDCHSMLTVVSVNLILCSGVRFVCWFRFVLIELQHCGKPNACI